MFMMFNWLFSVCPVSVIMLVRSLFSTDIMLNIHVIFSMMMDGFTNWETEMILEMSWLFVMVMVMCSLVSVMNWLMMVNCFMSVVNWLVIVSCLVSMMNWLVNVMNFLVSVVHWLVMLESIVSVVNWLVMLECIVMVPCMRVLNIEVIINYRKRLFMMNNFMRVVSTFVVDRLVVTVMMVMHWFFYMVVHISVFVDRLSMNMINLAMVVII